MARKSDREIKKRSRDAYTALSNGIMVRALSEQRIREYLARFIAYSGTEFRTDFVKIIRQPRVRAALQLKVETLSELDEKRPFGANQSRLLDMYELLIRSEYQMLAEFSRLARDFESEYLVGGYERALVLLDEIQGHTGESLWLIRHRLLVLSKAGRLDEMKVYADQCKKSCDEKFTFHVINCFLFVATDPILQAKTTIRATIRELEDAGIQHWADFLTLLLIPMPLVSAPQERLACLGAIQAFSLVDLFVLLDQLLTHNLASRDDYQGRDREQALYDLIRTFQPSSNWADYERFVDLYESGEYSACIEAFETSLPKSEVAITGANLAAKSLEILGGRGEARPLPDGAIYDLVDSLRSLYSLSASPGPAIDELTTAAIQTHQMYCGHAMQLLPYQVLTYLFPYEDRKIQAEKAATAYRDAPSWIAAVGSQGHPVLTHPYSVVEDALPAHRRVKSEIRRAVSSRDNVGLQLGLTSLESTTPLRRDFFEVASACLVTLGDIPALITICAEALAKDPHAYTAFPMKLMVEHIESCQLSDIDALVVTYSYVTNVDSSKEYLLNETYEEFLLRQGVRRPTELSLQGACSLHKIKIVLSEISSIDTMEFLGAFEGSNDVRAERIKILDVLLDAELIEPERHTAEVGEILAQATVDTAAAEFSVHRVDVNDGAIKRRLSEEVASSFQLYRAAVDAKDETFIKIQGGDEQKEVAAAVAVGDKNTVLLKIYNAVMDAFLFDEKHGLDKNLSGEIRHGFFANTMRSKPEERHLLTESDEFGVPRPNEYWIAANSLLTQQTLEAINEHLVWFSGKFNELISSAEEWMKISVDRADKDRVFNYDLFTHQFETLRAAAARAETSDEVLAWCLEFLWRRTEENLADIRERIDVDFRRQVDDLFEMLLDRLTEAKGPAAMTELMVAVRRTRNDVREEISTITEWFRRSDSLAAVELSVRELIAISIECYSRLRRIQVTSEVPVDVGDFCILVDGRQRKGLIAALMNLYENCIRHSGYGTDTPVSIAGEARRDGWRLSISNPVRSEVYDLLGAGGLRKAQERIEGARFSKLVRTEGGSGLRKVQNQLSSASAKFNLSIDISGGNFVAAIDYEATHPSG